MLWLGKFGKVLLVTFLSVVFFLTILYRRDLPEQEIFEKYQTPESLFIEVDGINVHVRIMGEGEPIILLHGSFASLHTWERWQKELSPYFMTISLDFPGHGLTGPDPLKRYSIGDYSHLVQRIAEKLNIYKFHLAGNSMGGAVALDLASNRSDKILTLSLIDAAGAPELEVRSLESEAKSDTKPWWLNLAETPAFSQLLLKCTPRFLFSQNLKSIYGDPSYISEELVDRYYELMLREGNRGAALDRISQRRKVDFDFERLTMPTLILWGQKDPWFPVSQGERFKKLIQKSNLVVFEEAGHMPMEEIPTESVSEYLSFLGVEVRRNYLEPPKHMVYAN